MAGTHVSVGMIILGIIFSQYESNREYSKNFMSAKISYPTVYMYVYPWRGNSIP